MTFPVTRYVLAKINLVKAACPHELCSEAANLGVGRMIVVEKNRRKLGYVEAADYFPPVVIVAGAETRSQLLKQGRIHGWALVENGAMELSSGEMIGAAETLGLLCSAITGKFYPRGIYEGQMRPAMVECHPFEGRVVYAMKDRVYAQRYLPDFAERRINLIGYPINACGNGPMLPVQTGARYSPGTVYPALAVSNRGAANSELVTGIIRDWSDIEEAVKMYLGASRRSSEVLRPRFEPVALDYSGKDIVYRGDDLKHALVKAGVDPIDFAIWSADAQHKKTKKVGSGEEVSRSKFLYAPSSDPSSWKLPVENPSHVRNALSRVNQVKGIPSEAKPGILQKLHKLAKHHGITTKPTSKQRHWAAQIDGTVETYR